MFFHWEYGFKGEVDKKIVHYRLKQLEKLNFNAQ